MFIKQYMVRPSRFTHKPELITIEELPFDRIQKDDFRLGFGLFQVLANKDLPEKEVLVMWRDRVIEEQTKIIEETKKLLNEYVEFFNSEIEKRK